MTIYDHIHELNAKHSASIDRADRLEIAAEIATAEVKLPEEEPAFEALIAGEPPH